MASGCCYVQCNIGMLNENTERVEVRSNISHNSVSGSSTSCMPVIKWSGTNEATFHRLCWEQLLKSARARKKNVDIKMSLDEKQMIKDAAKTAEYHDSKETLELEGRRIASMLESASYCVAFTGAGISTSAGIGDYRGKSGKWTLEDQKEEDSDEPPVKKRKTQDDQTEIDDDDDDEDEGVPYEDLRPTYTHEALKKLIDMDKLKYIISQNGDGLHGLSGVSLDKMSELHGNVFIEKCEKCGEQYEREFYVMDDHASLYYEELVENGKTDIIKPRHATQCKLCKLCHRTGRKCDKKGCNGYLIDSIINFCDNLDDVILDRAIEQARRCDLMLCLGTTLTVTPASTLIGLGKQPLSLVICNRQKTHMDKECLEKNPENKSEALGSRVFGDCDKLMREVMKNMLSGKDLKNWQDGRKQRMKIYNSKRKTKNKL